ncbi:MAG: LysR family transcriptional regulator [Hyphomicrobiales bacterium]
MQLNELRTFLAIIETGSLIKASEQLNVTQSTVTARLKSLEAEIGQSLINRQKSGVSLTAAGVRFQRYASTITNLWRQARQETSLPDALSSVCNIGCHPDLWPALGQEVFNYIRKEVPQVALSIWQGSSKDMRGWLDDGLVDFAITHSPSVAQEQEIVRSIDDQLILVSTEKDSPITFDPKYFFVEAGEAFGREHAATFADANTSRISFGSATLGLEYLLSEGGSAYLPLRLARPYIDKGEIHILEAAPTFERGAYLIVNKTAAKAWPWLENCLINSINLAMDK